MSENELVQGLVEYLKQEVSSTKVIAQSAIQMAQDNKLMAATLDIHLKNVNAQMEHFSTQMEKLADTAQKLFITKAEFEPVKKTVYGAVTIILAEFIGMLTYIVGWKL